MSILRKGKTKYNINNLKYFIHHIYLTYFNKI